MNLALLLQRSAQAFPHQPAVALGERIVRDYAGLAERVARLAESHVQAKRYLTFQYPEYYHALSEASRGTLRWQGGPMNETEALAFERDPDFDVILQLRQWDEQAKVEGKPVPDLAIFETILEQILINP